MEDKWASDLVALLKILETEGSGIHEFRRSFESGRKQRRIYPQVEKIYISCKDHLKRADFITWVDDQGFKLSQGQKEIALRSQNHPYFINYLLHLFSNWDSSIEVSPLPTPKKNTFSAKTLQSVLSKLGSVDDRRLTQLLSGVPREELTNLQVSDDLFQTEETRALAEQIAIRVKGATH